MKPKGDKEEADLFSVDDFDTGRDMWESVFCFENCFLFTLLFSMSRR